MNKKQFLLSVFAASLLGGAMALGGFYFFGNQTKIYQTIQQKEPVQFSNYSNEMPVAVDFVHAAEKVRPAVVHVKTYREIDMNAYKQQQYMSPFDYFFRDFFNDPYQQPQQQDKEIEKDLQDQPLGFGSGVIITKDGYIVTNNHVIEGADKIEVVLDDKRTFETSVIGTDPTTDLALLKVDEKDLPSLSLANSDDVKVGEWVLAVGNPFNLTSTVTAGIVSAKARNINIIRDKDGLGIESFIQTDAAVNPGNSGGALVNTNGDLIGINTAIQSRNGSFTGYAFAIPSSIVDKVVEDLKKYGIVQRALLGVSIRTVDAQLADEKGIKNLEGVYVAGVNDNSAAKDAGLEEGDIIVKINEVNVDNVSELQEQVARYRPGDKISVTFLRDGDEKVKEMTLKNQDGDTELVKKEHTEIVTALGAEMESLTKKELKALNIDGGVKIKHLNPGKLSRSGIREGFVITHIDRVSVKSPKELADILTSKEKKSRGMLIEGIYANGRKAYYGIEW